MFDIVIINSILIVFPILLYLIYIVYQNVNNITELFSERKEFIYERSPFICRCFVRLRRF